MKNEINLENQEKKTIKDYRSIKRELSRIRKLRADMGAIPFFYQNILDKYVPQLSMRGEEITKEEIENATAYLAKHKKAINKVNLTRLLGCDLFHNEFYKTNEGREH